MNILSIENLEKTLKDEPLFENVTLGLESGEKVGIVGKNGCGKSTFLKTISGAITPDEGKVSLRSGTNMVMLEQNVVYPEGCTVMDYLYLSKDKNIETLKEYHEALERGDEKAYTALGEKIEKENLWDIERSFLAAITDMGEDFSSDSLMESLSGGEQKKVAIARALANNPDILLADEPTGALDTVTSHQIMELLKEVAKDRLVIMVTHNPELADQYSTRIVKLKDGQVVGDSNPYMLDEDNNSPATGQRTETEKRVKTAGTAKTKKAIVKLTEDSKDIEIFAGL